MKGQGGGEEDRAREEDRRRTEQENMRNKELEGRKGV